MKRTFFISITAITLTLCMTPLLYAGAGRTAAQFLSLGGGTRAAALADAFSAISGDVTAAFWNPSGLTGIDKREATLAYTDYSNLFGEAGEGLYYALFAGAMPIGDWGVVGTTLQINGQGIIDITADSPDVIRQENLGTNWAWAVSYADEVAPNLLAGVSGKVIRQVLGPVSSTAYALDIGTQYGFPDLSVPIVLGAAIQNWGTRIQFKDEHQSDPLPRTFKLGAAFKILDEEYHKLQLVGDFTAFIDKLSEDDEEGLEEVVEQRYTENNPENKTKEQIRSDIEAERGVGIHAFRYSNMSKSIGAEYWLANILALRVGYKVDPFMPVVINEFEDHVDRVTAGIGIRYSNYQFDYALVPGGGPNNKRLNTFALLIRF
ncbi:TPA: PorV/PorQ family protein [Candidatus Poribacteria bacterium]|nr:PorV/PorQ family protein [Candidatus Poribacteria bacterium]